MSERDEFFATISYNKKLIASTCEDWTNAANNKLCEAFFHHRISQDKFMPSQAKNEDEQFNLVAMALGSKGEKL